MTDSTKRLIEAATDAETTVAEIADQVCRAIVSVPEATPLFHRLLSAIDHHRMLYGLCEHRAGFDQARSEGPVTAVVDPTDADTAHLDAPSDADIETLIQALRQAVPPVPNSEMVVIYGSTGEARHEAAFALAELEAAMTGLLDSDAAAVLQARHQRLSGAIRGMDIAVAYHRGIEVGRRDAALPICGLPVQ